jgi:hypothetical protein
LVLTSPTTQSTTVQFEQQVNALLVSSAVILSSSVWSGRSSTGIAVGDGYDVRMGITLPAVTVEEFQARLDAAGGPATHDDQCVTRDGRVLDTKDKVLAFLAEVADTRAEGRTLGPS